MKGEVKFLEFRAGTPRPVRQCDITAYDVFLFSRFWPLCSVKAIIKFSLIFLEYNVAHF